MVKNVVNLRDGKGEGGDGEDGGDGEGGDKKTLIAISKRDQHLFMRKVRTAESDMSSARGTIGQLVADVCENKRGHKGAIGIYRRLDKMDPYKRAELLFHFDSMRKQSDWDETDLFDRTGEAAE
jgi:hypothetical protein